MTPFWGRADLNGSDQTDVTLQGVMNLGAVPSQFNTGFI